MMSIALEFGESFFVLVFLAVLCMIQCAVLDWLYEKIGFKTTTFLCIIICLGIVFLSVHAAQGSVK